MIHEDKFKKLLGAHIKPAQPIDSPDLLQGRENLLQKIKRGFGSPGKHIFIYGERGVGKTSLALTAGYIQHPSTELPIVICSHDSSFLDLAEIMIQGLLKPYLEKGVKAESIGVNVFGLLQWKKDFQFQTASNRALKNVNNVVDALAEVARLYQDKEPVVVVDEFDAIESIL